jgi:hypothetical protein
MPRKLPAALPGVSGTPPATRSRQSTGTMPCSARLFSHSAQPSSYSASTRTGSPAAMLSSSGSVGTKLHLTSARAVDPAGMIAPAPKPVLMALRGAPSAIPYAAGGGARELTKLDAYARLERRASSTWTIGGGWNAPLAARFGGRFAARACS